jgi:hypothetical protein
MEFVAKVLDLLPTVSICGHMLLNLNTLRLVPAPSVNDTLLILSATVPTFFAMTVSHG